MRRFLDIYDYLKFCNDDYALELNCIINYSKNNKMLLNHLNLIYGSFNRFLRQINDYIYKDKIELLNKEIEFLIFTLDITLKICFKIKTREFYLKLTKLESNNF